LENDLAEFLGGYFLRLRTFRYDRIIRAMINAQLVRRKIHPESFMSLPPPYTAPGSETVHPA